MKIKGKAAFNVRINVIQDQFSRICLFTRVIIIESQYIIEIYIKKKISKIDTTITGFFIITYKYSLIAIETIFHSVHVNIKLTKFHRPNN